MNETTLSTNLQHLIRIHGNLSVSELARLTQIPQPTIHHILAGATKNPRKKALEALSDFFSVTVPQLIGEVALPNFIPNVVKEDLHLRTVPVVDCNALKNWPPPDVKVLHAEEILLEKKIAPNSFALLMKDSRMEPLFPQNALLIFDFEKQPQDRDFVIVHINRDDSILFNRLFTEDNKNYLKQEQEDGNVKLIKLDKATDRILGTLIEVRIQY